MIRLEAPSLKRLLTLLLLWTAALALPLTATPLAYAAESNAPCPMEAMGAAPDHGGMDCCDHGKGAPGQTSPCKPGAVCQTTAAALPASVPEGVGFHVQASLPGEALIQALRSRPPDRTLRPPISL